MSDFTTGGLAGHGGVLAYTIAWTAPMWSDGVGLEGDSIALTNQSSSSGSVSPRDGGNWSQRDDRFCRERLSSELGEGMSALQVPHQLSIGIEVAVN